MPEDLKDDDLQKGITEEAAGEGKGEEGTKQEAGEQAKGADESQEQAKGADESQGQAKGEGPDEEAKGDDKEQGGQEDADAADAVPESAEGYDFAPVLPEGVDPKDPLVNEFRKTVHGLGLSQRQAAAVVKFYGEFKAQEDVQRGRLMELADQALQDDWGERHAENLALANKAIERFGGPELLSELRESPLGVSPVMARAFYRIGRAISEDSFAPGEKTDNQAAAAEDEKLYGGIKK